jgi:aspartyl-tRNA(Asn)/glutamyl-tRNA(Gln) amidotransferase subunit A
MTNMPDDPLEPDGIIGFGTRLRRGEITAEEATAAYLARIDALDPKLQAFEHVAHERALAAARAMDALLAAGTDLGPLMGVPIAVKDILAVAGMPTTAGSLVDVSDIIGPEGGFIKRLKNCGCVILGKTTCVEFAFGTLGINRRRTPWNPWDASTQRIVGGSSSGSAVAVAAGMCALAIGTDTGASVRLPAGLCGVFGLRTNPGLWPKDGVFPLVPSMDCIGPLTRSAADAAVVFGALSLQPAPAPARLKGLRLGRPDAYFYDALDESVAACMAAALSDLEAAGVDIVPIDVPEARERESYFPLALPAYALGVLGQDRFAAEREKMDPIVARRCASGQGIRAAEFVRAERRRFELWEIARRRLEGLDAWVTPTAAIVPPPVSEFDDVESAMKLTVAITQDTQPGSLFGLCGTSTPVHMYGSTLPVGLQLLLRPEEIAEALSIALAIERELGAPPRPALARFPA